MRREVLQPDAAGRVPLDQLGFDAAEAVVAEEVEPGKWVLTQQQEASQAAAEILDAPRNEQELQQALAEAERGETTPRHKQEPTTVAFGTSGKRVARPSGAPPPGGPKRS